MRDSSDNRDTKISKLAMLKHRNFGVCLLNPALLFFWKNFLRTLFRKCPCGSKFRTRAPNRHLKARIHKIPKSLQYFGENSVPQPYVGWGPRCTWKAQYFPGYFKIPARAVWRNHSRLARWKAASSASHPPAPHPYRKSWHPSWPKGTVSGWQ